MLLINAPPALPRLIVELLKVLLPTKPSSALPPITSIVARLLAMVPTLVPPDSTWSVAPPSVELTKAPLSRTRVSPEAIVVPLTVAPPKISSVPPLSTIVPSALPPDSTTWLSVALTVVLTATPPDETVWTALPSSMTFDALPATD